MSTSGMALAGLHKLTAIDYPGLVAATVFTQGCNFRCPYCHNRQLIKRQSGETLLAEEDALAFLKKRASLLDGLVVSGGEPTLQPGLADFCRKVKKLGYRIKLDTNGSRPQVLAALMDEELVDYVAMDCKSAPGAYADFSVRNRIFRKRWKRAPTCCVRGGWCTSFAPPASAPMSPRPCCGIWRPLSAPILPGCCRRRALMPCRRLPISSP